MFVNLFQSQLFGISEQFRQQGNHPELPDCSNKKGQLGAILPIILPILQIHLALKNYPISDTVIQKAIKRSIMYSCMLTNVNKIF